MSDFGQAIGWAAMGGLVFVIVLIALLVWWVK
jgi:hypothetical protein